MYPCDEKRKGIIFSRARDFVCVRVCVCVLFGADWAFEGESRIPGVIMRTNAELYCNQDAYVTASKNVTSNTAKIYIAFSYLYVFFFFLQPPADYLMPLWLKETLKWQ